MVPDPKLAEAGRALLADGGSVDDLVAALREWGQSKAESIMVLRQVTELSLGDLQRLVHRSPTWADRRAEDDLLNDAFFDALSRLAEGDRPD